MTVDEFKPELTAGGYASPVVVTRDVGCALGHHAHGFDAVALITDGEITLTVGGAATRYAVGDVFRLPAGSDHLESAGPRGVKYLSARRELSRSAA